MVDIAVKQCSDITSCCGGKMLFLCELPTFLTYILKIHSNQTSYVDHFNKV